MKGIAFSATVFLAALPAAAQGWLDHLARFTEIPAVTGYEAPLAAEIRARLKDFSPQTDNLGNVTITLGSGAPHRLIVAPLDEPGYVVSAITPEGYLRVQRLPQTAPHGLFDLLHAAQPVLIHTRGGKWISGVVAGRSTHLQPGRRDAPRGDHPDDIYIDIGAANPAEVYAAGVDLLDPVALERAFYRMGYARLAGAAVGDRFGAAALAALLERLDRSKLTGTLTVAFTAQQWATSRGLDRLMQHVRADEMIYVGRLLPRRGGGFGPQQQAPRTPALEPGSGALIGWPEAEETGAAQLSGLAAELLALAEAQRIPAATDFTAPLPRVSYTRGPVLPERFAHLGVASAWPSTPAEFIHGGDLAALVALLEAYATGAPSQPPVFAVEPAAPLAPPATPGRPRSAPSNVEILRALTEVYGMSGHETAVRQAVEALLPPWARAETDERGNLLVRVGSPPAGRRVPRLLLVAHMDEIGYLVRSVADDGRLVVQSRGGGILEFFAGHAMLVHTSAGMRPGVMELPAGWDRPGFEWPRGPGAPLRVDVGARSPGEVEALGIRVGDAITVPKKYRSLYGTRASGRSFDDRVGSAALVAAAWALGGELRDRDVTFAWVVEEEVGLLGAFAVAERLAAEGRAPDYVFAVDTFVSADSPLESKRFADAPLGEGFVIRAIDNSNIAPRAEVDRLIALARANGVAVQYGITGGGNDGAVFLRHGAVDIPISWPLRYSHSPGEVIDTRDYDALAAICALIARLW